VVALRGDTLPVRGLPIEWEVTSGGATLSAVRVETDASGEASVLLTAGPVLGQVRVRTRRRDSDAAGPEFLLRTTAWGVRIEPDALVGPFGRDTLEVVAGDTVEWVNRDVRAHALATRESPAGGSLIRSGRLGNSERYRWVPNVPGVWIYEDTLAASVTPRIGAVRAVDRLAVGELRVIATLQGESLFPGFVVLLDAGAFRSAVDANASVLFPDLSATTHLVQLLTEDPACAVSGANPRLVRVPEGGRLSILFEVLCD
jgi:plastocyanin